MAKFSLWVAAALQRAKRFLGRWASAPESPTIIPPLPPAPAASTKILFKPNSRPLESNHSCRVCAPPPDPPPPIAIASRPSDSGIFASVDARCTCAHYSAAHPRRVLHVKSANPQRVPPPDDSRLPPTSQFTPEGRFCADDRISRASVSSSTARFSASRSVCSNRSISAIEVDRISLSCWPIPESNSLTCPANHSDVESSLRASPAPASQ